MRRTPQSALVASVCAEVSLKSRFGRVTTQTAPDCAVAPLRRAFLRIARACVLLPSIALAQQDTSKFDPVDHYGSRLLAGLIVAGIVLVVYSLFRYRGRAAGWASWGVLVLGAAVIPAVVTSAGGVLVLQRSQRVQLCNSCHLAMSPYVDDMKNPKSHSLAAIHYANRYIEDNQCFQCHTSYGMFGVFQAKEQGLSDVYRYYTHTYAIPIEMKQSYPNNDCLKCHAGSAKFLAAHTHDRAAMFADEVSCMQCHEDDNPAHNLGKN